MNPPSFPDLPQVPDKGLTQIRRTAVSGFRPLRLSLAAGLLGLFALTASAATFTVNSSTDDIHDGVPGDGICETAKNNHICTLRAAIDEANALDGADTIQLQANTTYVLSLTSTLAAGLSADLVISDSVTLTGAGPESSIIDGNGMVTGRGVLIVARCIRGIKDGVNCTYGSVTASISSIAIVHGFAPAFGGAILNDGILSLDHARLSGNTAGSAPNTYGGAISNSGALAITSSIISNNNAGSATGYGYGGAIYNQGPMTISGSTISDNSTLAGPDSHGYGGAIYSLGYGSSIVKSTIGGNLATAGGGIFHSGQPLWLINATISGNLSTGDGGGVYNSAGTLGLYNVTVTENQANADESGFEVGGGLYNDSEGTLTIANSIVAGNTRVIPTAPYPTLSPDECGGTITSYAYNLMTGVDTSHCTIAGGVLTMKDPLLGPLQFNGGPTRTHALSAGSPAIDNGNQDGCVDPLGALLGDDQRGVHRPSGSRCDIGAFEWVDVIFRNGFQAP